jgi:hypothetical protein
MDGSAMRLRNCRKIGAVATAAAAAWLSAGCTYDGFGSQELHYATFSVPQPKGATVHVCHAYGCRKQTKFTFVASDVESLRDLMRSTRGDAPDDAEQERRAVAYAVGWMETRVGAAIGTGTDRAGMDFEGSGDPTQQDCVDEATNTTSYLNVLANAGLIRHHTVGIPFAKENYLRGISGWTHWTAVLVERAPSDQRAVVAEAKSPRPKPKQAGGAAAAQVAGYVARPGQRWAVDSWIYANGENPAIVRAEEWYISDLESLPQPTR